jgi:acyl-[acyl-carrier-protein]-phospholipid O-acyltransferase/long-chain-fatty-acid--[acyl-carrier-protein] ligase
LATVVFSSGSTGQPKGVMLSHHNVISNVEGIDQVFDPLPSDRLMGVLPLFHSFGFTATLWFPLLSGCGAVYHLNPLDAKIIGELVSQHQATIIISTPTFYAAYTRKCSAQDFASLRYAVAGAEKLRAPVAQAFKEKYGLDLLEGYGCTEMGPVVSVNVQDVHQKDAKQIGGKPGTVGHPLPGVVTKIVDPDTYQPRPNGQEGLLLLKGPSRMLGYLNQAEKTAEVLQDGWYITGDIATIDEDGFLRLTDRLSRFSKIGGEMVPHLKIEELIQDMLGDADCVVTTLPDEQKGECLAALYTHQELTPQDIWEGLCHTDLPRLWIPKREHLYQVETIPVLGTGKRDLHTAQQIALERAKQTHDQSALVGQAPPYGSEGDEREDSGLSYTGSPVVSGNPSIRFKL